jgi:hypothetical protein
MLSFGFLHLTTKYHIKYSEVRNLSTLTPLIIDLIHMIYLCLVGKTTQLLWLWTVRKYAIGTWIRLIQMLFSNRTCERLKPQKIVFHVKLSLCYINQWLPHCHKTFSSTTFFVPDRTQKEPYTCIHVGSNFAVWRIMSAGIWCCVIW